MGISSFIKKIKNGADEKLRKAEDPAEQRKLKKEKAAKDIDRTAHAIRWAQAALKRYGTAAKKVDELDKSATRTAADIAEKIEPIAEKVDKTVDAVAAPVTKTTKGAFNWARRGLKRGTQAAADKIEAHRAAEAEKPSTGSSLLDLITPAVPEAEQPAANDAAPKKQCKKKTPKPGA